MARVRLVIGVAGALLASFGSAAQACLCQIGGPLEDFARSAAVFEGTVVAVAEEPGDYNYDVARVQVKRRWKLPDVAEISVATMDNVGACGQALQPGQTWLFYLRRDCELLVTSQCTRSTQIALADGAIAALGAPLGPGEVGAYTGTERFVDAGVCSDDAGARPGGDAGVDAASGLDAAGDPAAPGAGCSIGRRGDWRDDWAMIAGLALGSIALRRRRHRGG